MRIKRLDIQGFKSFADRTSLNFGTGITGVVGPNGCGKSNVVDAIRWAMGEQSAKHLRGGSMQDVIFSGSELRGPTGVAEVSLVFENDGRGFPTDYAQYNEIQVTRRLYRDGDSDYEINKTPCRLRDITELFLGTGIGKQGFSIIEQGQVATIIKSKPEERRRIIEEAAGITKYKARRQAAEKKMEATRQNLLRVTDVIREVQKRLGTLKRQAKKAERYRELKAFARDVELHQATLRYFELQNALTFERDLLSTVDIDRATLDARLAAIDAEIEIARIALMDDDKRLNHAQTRSYELNNEIALSEQKIAHADATVTQGDARDDEARTEISGLEEALVLIEHQKLDLAKGADDLEGDASLKEEELKESQAKLAGVTARRAEEMKKIDEIRRDMMTATTRVAQTEATRENLENRVAELEVRVLREEEEKSRVLEENESAKRMIADLDRLIADAETERVDMTAAKVAKVADVDTLKAALTALDKQILGEKEILAERRSRHSSLVEIHKSHERSPAGVRALLANTEGQSGMRGLFADLLDVPETIEVPVAALLHDALQSVVFDDAVVAIAELERLATDGAGRATAFVVEAAGATGTGDVAGTSPLLGEISIDDRGRGVVEGMLSRSRLLNEGTDVTNAWREARALGLTLVQSSGTVLEPSGLVRGGGGDGDDAHILRQKRQIKELEDEITILSSTLETTVKARDTQADLLVAAEQDLVDITTMLADLEFSVRDRTSAKNRLRDDLVKMDRRLSDLTDNVAELQRTREKLVDDLGVTKENHARAVAEREEKEAHMTAAASAIENIDHELADASESLTRLKVAAASAVERRENVRQSLAHHTKNEADIKIRVERLREQVKQYADDKGRLLQESIDAKLRIETLVKDSSEIKNLLESTREQYETAQNKVRGLEGEAKDQRRSLEEARKNTSDLTLRIRERELELDALRTRTQDGHHVRPEEILTDFHMFALPVYDVKERIADLRKQIDALGEINLTAIEECEEFEERYEFLKTQSDDLTHALEQLEKAIVKINRTTRKRFKESFEQINAQFEKVFPRLFRGGKAWLALTDPNDMLATGVEIYAQPPGKKLGSVALMSGGEQALTAVSLIFAIFLIKPSPFCLLDEVDAPLDESNVSRFTDLVKDVSNISQFIVITHNKRTMEAADQLYGITMEQPGVSKAVNVRVH